MKKILVLLGCVAMLCMVGCGEKGMSAEDFGKKYMAEKFAGQDVDLVELEYDVVENEDGTASVVIAGTIEYREEILLAKKGLSWVVTEKAPEAVEEEVKEELAAPAEHPVAAEEEAHPAKEAETAEKEHAPEAEAAHAAPKAEHH